jgi:hypothetical protein
MKLNQLSLLRLESLRQQHSTQGGFFNIITHVNVHLVNLRPPVLPLSWAADPRLANYDHTRGPSWTASLS